MASTSREQQISESIERKFRNFDVKKNHSDHYFSANGNAKQTAGNGNWYTNTQSETHKRIIQEWRILQKHLPETIFVRVYETRIDLLRAVIIGAQRTPYHDGLFFFDIAFPSNYPSVPPKVYHHSHGLRLNPNLYSSGYVCLSLLNTWNGRRNEKWDPSISTILQVLVSLQGIVLNDKPYFNEPGLKPGRSWQAYNEVVFALSCKNMLSVLLKPPRNFQAFVIQHFRERASNILSACQAYRNGCVSVGFFSADDASSSSHKKVAVSKRFRCSMDKLYPELYNAFAKVGASELENLSEMQVDDVIQRHGTAKKILCCFGF